MKTASPALRVPVRNAADDFFAITTENNPAYKYALETLAFLIAGGAPKGRNEQPVQWEYDFTLAIESDTWRGALYRSLSLQELAILLESELITHYSEIMSNYGMDQAFTDLLDSPLLSLNLKIGISVLRKTFRSTSLWICTEEDGKYLPVVIESIVQNFKETTPLHEDSQAQEMKDRAIHDALQSAVTSSVTVQDPSGRLVIDKMNHEVFTKELLYSVLSTSQKLFIDVLFSKPEMRSACAIHARRLYGFSEDIPDEWVFHAIK